MPDDEDFVQEKWDSADDVPNNKVTKTWESTGSRRPATSRIREGIRGFVQKAKAEREYRRSPECMQKKIDKMNQKVDYETAKTKVAKAKSARRSTNMGMFGGGGSRRSGGRRSAPRMSSGGMGSNMFEVGREMSKPHNYSGMDSMFGGIGSEMSRPSNYEGMNDLLGMGNPRKSMGRTTRPQKKDWSGMDDLF